MYTTLTQKLTPPSIAIGADWLDERSMKSGVESGVSVTLEGGSRASRPV